MKVITIAITSILALSLAGCGSGSDDGATITVKVPKVKKHKFEGSKFAPSQADMNYHAGWAMTVEKPKYNSKECSMKMNPAKIKEICKSEFGRVARQSIFEPRECRKGDERSHDWDLLVNPVSCNGRVDTPNFSTDALVVFHQVGDEWRARIDNYSRESFVEH